MQAAASRDRRPGRRPLASRRGDRPPRAQRLMPGGAPASARLAWAVETLDVQPGDRVLELGCGHGVALSLICARLRGGLAVGLDRSPKMTAEASRRTAGCIAAGRVRIVTAALHEADLGEERFGKVLAVHFPPLLQIGRAHV